MKEITTLNPQARELLRYTALQYMLDTFCENTKLGKAFADDEEKPASCILSLKHLLFLGGLPSKTCLDFLTQELLPSKLRDGQHIFFLLYPDEAWENALMSLFPESCIRYERSLYKRDTKTIDGAPYSNNIVEITPELMNSAADNLQMITDEVISTGTYDDINDYYIRGIGFTPVINNRICGFCTSEYPSKSAIAIGIEVLEEYQREGYGKAMTGAFLYRAAQRGLTVYWECWKNNIASVNTALSCGFQKSANYPILFLRL